MVFDVCYCYFFFSSRRRHTRCALLTGVQTCALPICFSYRLGYAESDDGLSWRRRDDRAGFKPADEGWDSEMIAYPHVFDHAGSRYMVYAGNGFGRAGMGFAVLEQEQRRTGRRLLRTGGLLLAPAQAAKPDARPGRHVGIEGHGDRNRKESGKGG